MKKVLSLLACVTLLCGLFISPADILVRAGSDEAPPSKPEGNRNYAQDITGWYDRDGGSNYSSYMSYADGVIRGHAVNSNQTVFLTKETMKKSADYVLEMDVTVPNVNTNNGDLRILLGMNSEVADAGIGLYLAKPVCSVYYFKNGAEDGGRLYKTFNWTLKEGGTQHIAIRMAGGRKLTVWVDGKIVTWQNEDASVTGVTEIEADAAHTPGTKFGFSLCGLANISQESPLTIQNLKMYSLSSLTDDDPPPSKPEGNRNYAQDITGWYDRDGGSNYSSYMSYADGVIRGHAVNSNQTVFLTKETMKKSADYVLEMDVTIPNVDTKNGDLRILLGMNNQVADAGIGLYLAKPVCSVYYFKNNGEDGGRLYKTFDWTLKEGGTQHIAIRMAGGRKLTVWVDGEIVTWQNEDASVTGVTEIEADAAHTPGTKFGFSLCNLANISQESPLTIQNLKMYSLSSLKEETEAVIAKIPPITHANYNSQEIERLTAEVEAAVTEWLAADSANTTDALSNYSKVTEAQEQIAYWKANSAEVEALSAVDSALAAIPVITPDNYEAALAGSIKAAEDALAEFQAAYPDYDVSSIPDYRKLAASKAVAENQGVANNRLYYASGLQAAETGGYTLRYDRWGYAGELSQKANIWNAYQFTGVSMDPDRIYRFAADVTSLDETMDPETALRFVVKGSDRLNNLYVGLYPDAIRIYDPLGGVEQHSIAKGSFQREAGKTYRLEIIVAPEYITVSMNGQVVISCADLTQFDLPEYSGQYVGLACWTETDTAAKIENMELSYYNGIELTPSATDNLLDAAVGVEGNESNTGFYGIYDASTHTLQIKHSGLGGVFTGVSADNSKPYIYSAKVQTAETTGRVVMQIDGETIYEGLCVSLGESGLQVYKTAYGEIDTVLASKEMTVEANKAYAVTLLAQDGKLSVFVDGACLLADVETNADYSLGCVAAYTADNNDAVLTNIQLYYASPEELAAWNALKDGEVIPEPSNVPGSSVINPGNATNPNVDPSPSANPTAGPSTNPDAKPDDNPVTGAGLPLAALAVVLASAASVWFTSKRRT